MKLDRLDAPLLLKLLQLDRHAERLAGLAESAEGEIALAREYLNGKREGGPRVDVAAIGRGFEARLAEAKRRRAAADTEQRVLSSAKVFLEMLPADSALEMVETPIDGLDLADVRARKLAVAAEVRTLRAVPVPSADIRERIARYVGELGHAGRPEIAGVAGGALKVHWPTERSASRGNLVGFAPESANALLLAAFMQPELLVERLLATIAAETSQPMPPPQRLARIGELERELVELGRREVALVDVAIADGSDDEIHAIDTSPEALLGCRVVAAAASAAA